MFQYEFEKRPPSASSCESRSTATTEWSRSYTSMPRSFPKDSRIEPSESRTDARESRSGPNGSRSCPSARQIDLNLERARRPLPPRPIAEGMPNKTTVPLKVWIIASASCFAVCAALVLATVVITKWGTSYSTREVVDERREPMYANFYAETNQIDEATTENSYDNNEIEAPILEKLSIFKNMVRNTDLTNKPQIHPIHDAVHHGDRKIEKKDKAHIPESLKNVDLTKISVAEANEKIIKEFGDLPEFKPIDKNEVIKLPENFINDFKNSDYEEYYNDENLYEDYMQSNSMTNYLIEKVQELHDWITTDPDFEKVKNNKIAAKTDFGGLLKALNESLVEGNITIVMNKLKDLYFGENYTSVSHGRKVLLNNGTDLISFGILSLDVMLLHNIQLMAWENQEAAKTKMLKDPDVFAFNALFMDPTKVEAKQKEVDHVVPKRPSQRHDADTFDLGANLLENVIEVGVSAARAAIHLGRAYKNTKNILNQLSHHDAANIQNQISRNIDDNTHALNHLQTSFVNVASANNTFFTELDCVWLLYCRNLAATAKLNAPFGTMARINGMALRMLAGDLSTDKALDTMLYEVLTGWTDLRCNEMFPKCSNVNAAEIVMNTILQPVKKSSTKKGR